MAKTLHVEILKNDFLKLARLAPQKADQALRALANEGVTDVKLIITNSPPTGREYARAKGRKHVASAPGEAPRVDTGTLRASIRFRAVARLTYEIVDGVEYGAWLEFGTSKIEPRPFMTPMAFGLTRKAGRFFDHFWE